MLTLKHILNFLLKMKQVRMRIMCTINNKKKYEINKGMAIKTGDDTMYRKQKALDFCQQMRKQERCRTVV